jgi:hypothetical protein
MILQKKRPLIGNGRYKAAEVVFYVGSDLRFYHEGPRVSLLEKAVVVEKLPDNCAG